ncbi:DHA2 family efflux MFS transporter permease subunit [Volucribacter amazonae]|uniref:MFS transporter n=1 Tax=Volucribacter amazonae TaxID=256731 RepID=A0A9X4PC49_9PAST|nr:DHA2 family efflux MFS transporter permease subunit [Volucribacter amazonae]MDG6895552.1 MFS transporter [Volucribacter amazonae]
MHTKDIHYYSDNPNFPSKWIIGSLFIGAFLGYLNDTLLNVALTPLMQEFSVERTLVQWLVTGFLLVMGAFTPLTASLIQWLPSKKMALITLAIFASGSLICGFAPSFAWLLVGRIVQAVSAAFTVPLLINTIFTIYPPGKRGTVMGLVTMMFTVAPAIGPTLSGFIVDHLGWRYLFLAPLPLLGFAFMAVSKYFNIDVVEINRPKIDLLSSFFSILGVGGMIYAISNYAHFSLLRFATILLISLLCIAYFVYRQGKLATPMLNLRVLTYRQFRYIIMILFLAYFIFMGLELLMPMYSQQVLLLSATASGLVLFPASVLQALASPLLGVILDKKGGRYVMLPAALFMLTGLILLLVYMDTHSNPIIIAACFALFALSISCAITGETHGLNSLPKSLYPHGTALISTLNPIAGALGAAIFVEISAVVEHQVSTSPAIAQLIGIKTAIACGLVLALFVAYFATKVEPHLTNK